MSDLALAFNNVNEDEVYKALCAQNPTMSVKNERLRQAIANFEEMKNELRAQRDKLMADNDRLHQNQKVMEAELAECKAVLRARESQISDLNIKLQEVHMPIHRNTYEEAARHYGSVSQFFMAMEEMAELMKELSKNVRGQRNTSAVSEEIADVEIMLEQLKVIFGNRAEVDVIKGNKLCRLAIDLEKKMY